MTFTPEKEELERTSEQVELMTIAPPLTVAILFSNVEFKIVDLQCSMKARDPPLDAVFPWKIEDEILTFDITLVIAPPTLARPPFLTKVH